MSDNVQSAMLEILKSIQASIARLDERVANLEQGQAELKNIARKQRRDIAGVLVLVKSAAGDFDERVTVLEERMDALESRPRG
jgi:predicted  nucleic acid-binding Zn-ribbon protein